MDRGKYVVLPEYIDLSFEEELEKSKNDNRKNRLERISRIKITKPEIYIATIAKFKRNPDVVAEVLSRVEGKCEKCNQDAPFIRKSDKTPYLEVHYILSLANGGDDVFDNCIAVCSNCHRQLHYGD